MIEILVLISVIFAILSLEDENMLHSIAFLGLMGLAIAVTYYLMGATLIALFQVSLAASSIMVIGYLIFSMSKEVER